MTPQSPTRPPPRRRLWQFSLLWLLALVIVCSLIAAWYGERLRLEEAEERVRQKDAENRELRVALGILDDRPDVLTIADRGQVHVYATPDSDDLHWRWRIFLPADTAWDIEVTHGEVWDPQRLAYSGGGSGTSVKLTGEFTIDARITRDVTGRAYVEIQHGRSRHRSYVPEAGLAILQHSGKATTKIGGMIKQESFAPTGQIELLRLYRAAEGEPTPAEPHEGWGISIKIEEKDHKMARFKAMRAGAGN